MIVKSGRALRICTYVGLRLFTIAIEAHQTQWLNEDIYPAAIRY